jgi:hypothetical protein
MNRADGLQALPIAGLPQELGGATGQRQRQRKLLRCPPRHRFVSSGRMATSRPAAMLARPSITECSACLVTGPTTGLAKPASRPSDKLLAAIGHATRFGTWMSQRNTHGKGVAGEWAFNFHGISWPEKT